MKVRARNIFGSVAVGALACSALIAAPAFAAVDGGLNTGSSSGEVNRVQGIDRFATAIAASKTFDAVRGEGDNTVIVANYLAWADVLAATPLAAELNANVLYSYADELESRTKAELVRLYGQGVRNVLFVGGDGVVTDALLDEVANLKNKDGVALNLNVDRVGGEDRYSTAQLLAAETINEYNGVGTIADAREALRVNIENRSAVAKANADVTKKQAAQAKTTQAYLSASAAVVKTNNDITALTKTLKPGSLTPEQLEALKVQIDTRQADVNTAWDNLGDVLDGDPVDQDALATAQAALVDAQAALKLTQDQYQQAVAGVAANKAILDQIDALVKKLGDEESGQIKAAADAQVAAGTAFIELAVAVDYAANGAPAVQAEALENAKSVQGDYDKAVKAALAAGTEHPAFLATGMNFADALSAGPAAAQEQGVVLLTRDGSVPAATQAYLDSKPATVAVGGWAASAVKADTEFVGADRYETAAKVAAEYQAAGGQLALTSGLVSADAVVAGAAIANVGGAVVLTDPTTLSAATQAFFQYGDYTGAEVIVFGGTGAVSNGVVSAVKTAING